MSQEPAPTELAVAEIERRLQWRAMPALMFLGILALLLAVAFWPSLFPPKHIAGLPDDPDVFAAANLLRAHVTLPVSDLRFESAITGDVIPGMRAAPDADERLTEASRLLHQAHGRFSRDVRMQAARAALDLVQHRYREAELRYRSALNRFTDYPEARLGLGVTLALAGQLESHPLAQRQRFLRAIAQFAAVAPREAEYEEALFNRALLLERVGRREEAARYAREYLGTGSRVGAAKMWALAKGPG
jgi:tetratricopeptide (TPR) repeat protein